MSMGILVLEEYSFWKRRSYVRIYRSFSEIFIWNVGSFVWGSVLAGGGVRYFSVVG